MSEIEFDIRGQICPSTLLFTLRAVNAHARELEDGSAVLAIKTDHRDAINTIPESVGNMGYSVDVKKEGGLYVIRIGCGG